MLGTWKHLNPVDFEQYTLMIALCVIVIYSIRDFILVFKLHTFPISTHPSTVIQTNLFQTNCKICSFDAPTCFGLKQQGVTVFEYNNNIYLLQLGCYLVAVVILHAVYYATCQLEIVNYIHVVSFQN